jgi:arylsulfatase A-like enzyme
MRRLSRSGGVAGALVGAALFALDFAGGQVGFMGLDDPRVIAEVVGRARAHAIGQQLLMLALLVALCALFGAAGALAGRAWDLARGRSPGRAFLRGLAGALFAHYWFLARSMAQFPQLYSAHWYERRGLRGAAMVGITDHLSTGALDVLMAIVLLFAFVVPLTTTRGRGFLARHARLAVAAVVGVAFVAAAVAIAGRHHAPAKSARPSVLLLAVDSLRADRVFAPDAASKFPTLAALAARGVRFREAYVTQARTFPSFVALLTGRFPSHHGIRHEFPPASARAAIGPSLPAALRAAGWRTAAVSDFAGEIFSRTPLGFDAVDVPLLNLFSVVGEQLLTAHPNVLPYASTRIGRRLFPATGITAELEDPEALADRAIAQLDRFGADPYFLTVFFSAPHTPYAAPSPFWHRFADAGYRGPYRYLKQPLPQLPVLPPEEARQVQALYDGAVASVDAAIARLLTHVDPDTIVVLLGDHGENLFDLPGRGMGHGDHLWGDLANHIPLVITDRRHAPRDVGGIVRDVDLAPTLGALTGVAAPPGDGLDLTALLDGTRDSLDLHAFEESGLWLLESGPGYRARDRLPYPDLWHVTEAGADGDIFLQPRWEAPSTDAKVRAVRTPRYKLVRQPAPDGLHYRLFDVIADPEQRNDVAAEHPDVVAELRAELEAWISDSRSPDAPAPLVPRP